MPTFRVLFAAFALVAITIIACDRPSPTVPSVFDVVVGTTYAGEGGWATIPHGASTPDRAACATEAHAGRLYLDWDDPALYICGRPLGGWLVIFIERRH